MNDRNIGDQVVLFVDISDPFGDVRHDCVHVEVFLILFLVFLLLVFLLVLVTFLVCLLLLLALVSVYQLFKLFLGKKLDIFSDLVIVIHTPRYISCIALRQDELYDAVKAAAWNVGDLRLVPVTVVHHSVTSLSLGPLVQVTIVFRSLPLHSLGMHIFL